MTSHVTARVGGRVSAFCQETKSAKEIKAKLGLKHWKTFQANCLTPSTSSPEIKHYTARPLAIADLVETK
jgi:hypothetical protein